MPSPNPECKPHHDQGSAMSMDLSEFLDVFLEECFEGLEVMEAGLLHLDEETDLEEINTIFRAAHSIKGGSAAFGFNHISEFTHVMETLLDRLRSGKQQVSQDIVDVLLASVDTLREMVEGLKDETGPDEERVAALKSQLEAAVAQGEQAASGADTEATPATDPPAASEAPPTEMPPPDAQSWRIRIEPDVGPFTSGSDPLRLFGELARLGKLEVSADLSALPRLDQLDPTHCYLGWTLTLRDTPTDKATLEDLFAWLGDDARVTITPLDDQAETETAPAQPEPPATTATEPSPAAETMASDPQSTNPTEPPPAKEKPAAETAPAPKPKASPPAESRPPLKAVKGGAQRESGSIRVSIEKVDLLINLVGELVITQSMLNQAGMAIAEAGGPLAEALLNGLAQLERNTRELQENVLLIRMLPISFAFNRFPRLVRDVSHQLGKKVELVLTGEQTEVDKTVLEKIGDPLVHLVRNAIDHGLETPEERKAAGKPETGRLELSAQHESGNIVIRISDDGRGLDREKILKKAIEKGLVAEGEELSTERIDNLIFQPGFSTADKVSDLSGRGVGMDVVKRNINDLGGTVSIHSEPGRGSTVVIRLPLTLAILDGQLAQVGSEIYILPLISIVESTQIRPENLKSVKGATELYRFREEYIPIVRLNRLFGIADAIDDLEEGLLVVVESEGRLTGLFVDRLLGQQQVVIKSLETNFHQLPGISGATILGDGQVALILDIPGLVQLFHTRPAPRRIAAGGL